MNGHVLQGTQIAVDYWKIGGKPLTHFLTHLHGDHTVGLTSSWNCPIYCSEFTAHLLKCHYGISPKFLNITPINQSILVPLSPTESCCVTAYEADHCPGAVMFYFEGNFGNIFYTGDFRASTKVIDSCRCLRDKVDQLYIDNTFCSPACIFPSREECFKKIVKIVREHPHHDIVIGVRKLGKEDMLAKLGVAVDENIFVSPQRLNISQLLFTTAVFTTSALKGCRGRIRTAPMHQISRRFLAQLNTVRPTIAIIPSAIYTGLDVKPFCRDPDVFVVPYSDHSSYLELVQFVAVLRPGRIHPIVTSTKPLFGTDISNRSSMLCFSALLNKKTYSSGHFTSHTFHPVEEIHSGTEACKTSPAPLLIFPPGTVSSPLATPSNFGMRKRKYRSQTRPLGKRSARGVAYEEIEEVECVRTDPELKKSSHTSDQILSNDIGGMIKTVAAKPDVLTTAAVSVCGNLDVHGDACDCFRSPHSGGTCGDLESGVGLESLARSSSEGNVVCTPSGSVAGHWLERRSMSHPDQTQSTTIPVVKGGNSCELDYRRPAVHSNRKRKCHTQRECGGGGEDSEESTDYFSCTEKTNSANDLSDSSKVSFSMQPQFSEERTYLSTDRKDPCTERKDPCADRNVLCADRNDPCADRNDPCADRNVLCADRNDRCADRNDPCADRNNPCADRNNPCADRNNPCADRNVLCADRNVLCSTDRNDPCADRNDPCADRNVLCADRNDPCADRNVPCADRNVPCADRNDLCADRNFPCADRNDPCADRNVPCADRNVPCADRNDLCADRNVPCADRNDPCADRNVPCADRNDLCADRNDPVLWSGNDICGENNMLDAKKTNHRDSLVCCLTAKANSNGRRKFSGCECRNYTTQAAHPRHMSESESLHLEPLGAWGENGLPYIRLCLQSKEKRESFRSSIQDFLARSRSNIPE